MSVIQRFMAFCGISMGLSGPSYAQMDINQTTDRYVRTSYACKVATTPNLKPDFAGMDNLRVSDHLLAYTDLYGDGSIDLIVGAADEPFRSDDWFYRNGNRERSRQTHQYYFYSPDPDFTRPDGTRFLMARHILVQDFNGDGVDDVSFVQHGPDQRPFVPRRNEIMLSGPAGYSVSYLPSGSDTWHGGAAGDVDGDGDVDLIVASTGNDKVGLLLNNGSGNFTYREIEETSSGSGYEHARLNAFLWDFDSDGILDVLSDGEEVSASITWGVGGAEFRQGIKIAGELDNTMVQDFFVGDSDGDGSNELLVLVSRNTGAERNFYHSWAIIEIELDGRELGAQRIISEATHDPRGGYNWIAKFSGCDLQQDGDLDFVFDQHGERWWASYTKNQDGLRYDLGQIDKLVWINDGGQFDLFRVEHPRYFHPRYAEWLEGWANGLGVTTRGYQAPILNPLEFPDRVFEAGESRPTQYVWYEFMPNDRPNLARPLNDLSRKGWFDEFNNELMKLWNQR